MPRSFRDGLVTPFGDAHWPLDETANTLEYKFVTGVCDFETPLPSAAVSAVAKVLADRFRILIDILAAGKVVDSDLCRNWHGRSDRTFAVGP